MKLKNNHRGQAAVELAFQIPLLIALLFGAVQIARVFYTYHTLQKAMRGGAGLLARSINVNYCDSADTALMDARNFMVYGNLQGEGSPIMQGLDAVIDQIQIVPERSLAGTTGVVECLCTENDTDSCNTAAGGRAPDFVVVNFGTGGFPLALPFSYVHLGTINLKVSVRMPVTGS